MKSSLLLGSILCFLIACSSSKTKLANDSQFILTEKSSDASYGYSPKNPIKVGGVGHSSGPKNERRFLNALAGPNGEKISYSRISSCCPFNTKNGDLGMGMLDKYALTWSNTKDTLILYLNMYDAASLKVPVGLELKNKISPQNASLKKERLEISLDENFALSKGKIASYNKKLFIEIKSIQNNLCPPNMKCPRAGEIIVHLLISHDAKSQSHSLTFPVNNQSNQIRFEDWQIKFLGPTTWLKQKENPAKQETKINEESSMSFRLSAI